MNRSERRKFEKQVRRENKIPRSKKLVPTEDGTGLALYSKVPLLAPQATPTSTDHQDDYIFGMLEVTQSAPQKSPLPELRSKEAILTSAKQESALMHQNLDAYLENLAKYAAMLSSEVRNKLYLNSNRLETAYNTNAAAQVIGSEVHTQIKEIDFEEIRKSHILGIQTIDLTDEIIAIVKSTASTLNHSIKNVCGLMETLAYTDFSLESEIRELIDEANKSLEEALAAKEEMAKQEEIQRLLARLKELGYDPATETKQNENESFVTVERREEVVPVIAITLNGEPLTMSVDEAIAEIKRWRANLPKKSSKDNPLDNQDNIDHLKLIEKLSFVKQKDRTSLFKYDFDWSYNTFWYRFKAMVAKYNIKLWCRYRMTFDR